MTADVFIWTTGGRRISLVNPTVEDVAPELIAGPLSRLCRWTGHVGCDLYSVAQHCVVVSHLLTPEHALAGLLHDAAEPFTGDLNSPMKAIMRSVRFCGKCGSDRQPCGSAFDVIGANFDALISERYRVDLSHPDIHIADAVAAIFEARILVGVPDEELAAFFGDLMPVAELLAMTLPASVGSMLAPLAPRDAERCWLQRLDELGGTR